MTYESVVDKNLFSRFPMGKELMSSLFTFVDIEQFMHVANILCPEIIRVHDCVLISYFEKQADLFKDEADMNFSALEKMSNEEKTEREKIMNCQSVGELFMNRYTPELDDDEILDNYAEVLAYFWRRRIKELFPDEDIVVEIIENFYGEFGPTIVVYKNR